MLSDHLNPKLVQLADYASRVGGELNLPFYEKMPDSEPDSRYLERGLRALAEGDMRMGVRQDGTPRYRSLRDNSVGSRDVVFDGYFRDPPRDERTVDPSMLSDDVGGGSGMSSGVQTSARKGKKRARDVSNGNTSFSSFQPQNPRADVSAFVEQISLCKFHAVAIDVIQTVEQWVKHNTPLFKDVAAAQILPPLGKRVSVEVRNSRVSPKVVELRKQCPSSTVEHNLLPVCTNCSRTETRIHLIAQGNLGTR